MTVTARREPNSKTVTISVSGRFDFGTHQDFRNAYRQHSQPGDRFVLDLRQTEYLDSSALGMLLLLREQAGGDSNQVRIQNCAPAIRQILMIANFQRLFVIE